VKKIQCCQCGQTFWKELSGWENQVASGEWIENPCPVCGAEWAVVEPRARGRRRGARRGVKPAPRARVRRKRAAIPASGKPSGFTPARIRGLRKRLGLSQKELSSLMKVNRATVALWEAGKFSPKEDKMAKLADFAKMGKKEIEKLLAK